jgi:hypothetical protein
MPPEWAVAVRVGSQLPRYGVGRTWNFDAGPIPCGPKREIPKPGALGPDPTSQLPQ